MRRLSRVYPRVTEGVRVVVPGSATGGKTEQFRVFQTSNMLGQVMQARSFDPGSRYSDHIDGDKMAGYGIAALVGAIAGAKVVKVAAGLGLLVLLKKFFIVPI